MQITLKQTDIVSALKLYVAAQGIALAGKSFDVSFTAGRKNTGLSAELTIEDLAPAPVNSTFTEPLASVIVSTTPTALVQEEAATQLAVQVGEAATEEVGAAVVEATPVEAEPEQPAVTQNVTSLFGS